MRINSFIEEKTGTKAMTMKTVPGLSSCENLHVFRQLITAETRTKHGRQMAPRPKMFISGMRQRNKRHDPSKLPWERVQMKTIPAARTLVSSTTQERRQGQNFSFCKRPIYTGIHKKKLVLFMKFSVGF